MKIINKIDWNGEYGKLGADWITTQLVPACLEDPNHIAPVLAAIETAYGTLKLAQIAQARIANLKKSVEAMMKPKRKPARRRSKARAVKTARPARKR